MFDISNTEVAQQGTATQSTTASGLPASNALDGQTNKIAITGNDLGKNRRIVF